MLSYKRGLCAKYGRALGTECAKIGKGTVREGTRFGCAKVENVLSYVRAPGSDVLK